MSYQAERKKIGESQMDKLHLSDPKAPRFTPFRRYKRDFLFAEVWSRPILTLAERWAITICCVAYSANPSENERYVHGALASGALTLAELRELVLQFGVYTGWGKAELLDDAISAAADRLGLADAEVDETSLSLSERKAVGADCWVSVMTFPAPTSTEPYTDVGILPYVFGEMWDRPALGRKIRRLITVACCGMNDAEIPIRAHIYASLSSGDVSETELFEFILQYACYAGWPKASDFQEYLRDVVQRTADNRAFYGP